MNNKDYNYARKKLAVTLSSYDDLRAKLGQANRDGSDKSRIFVMLNRTRAIILNTMMEIAVEIERRRPLDAMLDRVTRENTAFHSYFDLIASTGDHYSPSMDMREPQMKFLADHFDKSSELLGKSCRAYRYGAPIFESDRV